MPVVLKIRGVAYCMDMWCRLYASGVFLLGSPRYAACRSCGHAMHVVMDSGYREGSSCVVGRVRVEFNYDPGLQRFKEAVELLDKALRCQFDTYVYKAPTIQTEKRATKLAHMIMFMENLTDAAAPGEVLINFDVPINRVREQCERVARIWQSNAILTEVAQ